MELVNGRTAEEVRRYDRFKLIVAVLLALLLLWLWFAGSKHEIAPPAQAPGPVATAPEAPVTATPARFAAEWNASKLTLRGTVRSADEKAQLVTAAEAGVGAGNVIDELVIDPNVAALDWLAQAPDLFSRLKALWPGGIALEETRLRLTGQVGSEADRLSIEKWARGFFSASAVENLIVVKAAEREPPPLVASPAPAGGPGFDAIHFAHGSASLDARARAQLDGMAAALKKTGASVDVTGHADNTGTAKANLLLGKTRAQAVKTYLVSRGVPARHIRTATQGDTNPAADNATVEGRARNRRVEIAIR